jgi:hypothetical protein
MSLPIGYLVGAEPVARPRQAPAPLPAAELWPVSDPQRAAGFRPDADSADGGSTGNGEAALVGYDPRPGPRPESGPAPVSADAIPGRWLLDARIGWRADGRPVPRLAAEPSAPGRRPGRPTPRTRPPAPVEPIVARLLAGTLATPAGRFFEPALAGSLPPTPAPPGIFTVHLGTGPAGFEVNGRPVPPDLLARLIRACPEWRGQPLLMLPRPLPTPSRFAALIRALIAGVRVPVYTADAGVWLLPGGALTGTTFRRWSGPADGQSEPATSVAVGRWLPYPVDPAVRVSRGGAPLAPRPAPRPEPVRQPEPASLPVPVPEPVQQPEPAPLPVPLPGPVPLLRLEPVPLPAGGRMSAPGPMPGVVRRVLPAATPWSPPAPAAPVGASSLGAASPADLAGGGPRAGGSASENPEADGVSGPTTPTTQNGSSDRGPSGHTVAGNGGNTGAEAGSTDGGGSVHADGGARDLLPWLAVLPRVTVEDRERLRALLGWHYEAHARAVLSALALQPGLRAGPGPDDLLAGLVAVRAYLSAEGGLDAAGRSLDAVLRDARRRPDEDGRLLLGRCAQAGIGRLPAVVGPVFRPAAPEPGVVRRYRAGDMLVEPAFLEASTTPWDLPGRTVEYVIWSSTARRTAWLGLDSTAGGSPSHALFLAGTRFVVLGVDLGVGVGLGTGTGTGEAPARVLLREAVGGRAERGLDERALGRLRDALAGRSFAAGTAGTNTEPAGVPAHLQCAVGLGDGGRPFALDGARRADALEPAGPS